MEFSGRLVSFPIAELLQWAYNDRSTGSLVVRRSSREKRIYFDKGRIVACISDQANEYYGQHLLLSGLIDQDILLGCLVRCRRDGKRLGQGLEESGALDRKSVKRTLKEHIQDVICDIFLWEHGIFVFRAEAPPREEILADPIDTLNVALEGARWHDEYRRIRKFFDHDQIVPGRRQKNGVKLDEIVALGPRTERIFRDIDGQKTLAEIHEKVGGSYFRFLDAAFELRQKGFIEIVDIRQDGGISTSELSLRDVLFEQAAEEQVRSARRRFTSPLGALERFVPIWVREPPEEEWEKMPEDARDFYRQLDGSRRISEIFSYDEDKWHHETELLMLQITRERIALLPAPLAELDQETSAVAESPWWRRLFATASKS